MTFNEQYPDAVPGAERRVNGDAIFLASQEWCCGICGAQAPWMSISFEAYYCSEECLEKEWEKFAEAERKAAARGEIA